MATRRQTYFQSARNGPNRVTTLTSAIRHLPGVNTGDCCNVDLDMVDW